MKDKVLVAGIGNIFLGDDAFGVEVAQQLAQRPLPSIVEVRDYGIRSYDLAYALMEDWELVILVDAVPAGDAPGTVYVIEPESPGGAESSAAFDAHTMNPVSVLQLVTALGGTPARILVVGCEPERIDSDEDGQIGLSEPVRRAVDEAVRVIEDLVARQVRAKAA